MLIIIISIIIKKEARVKYDVLLQLEETVEHKGLIFEQTIL